MISLSYFECFVSLVRIPCQSTNRSHILIIVYLYVAFKEYAAYHNAELYANDMYD